jgi:CRP-like cAMP-binding protein
MSCSNHKCPFFQFEGDGDQASRLDSPCMLNYSLHALAFDKGEILFLQGQPSSSLYSLTQGTVKICSHTPDGQERIVGMSSPGSLLVGLQSINDTRHAYTAIAVTPVLACKLNHRTLLENAQQRGEVALRLVQAAGAQLAHSRALMEVLGHKCAAAKVASFILLMTSKAEQGESGFVMPFSRADMAGILGLSEETVCRLMANMKRSGAIYAPRGKMEIRDWNQLQAISEGSASHVAM